ncbi:hypothetical protein [Algiphilus sp.]|uniref:hypothetical protein n=1 Tax=Algiphilus sp. TaxID=1872431 RepID=UPI003B527906
MTRCASLLPHGCTSPQMHLNTAVRRKSRISYEEPEAVVFEKPPKPIEDHQLIEEWIANAKPALNSIVSELDRLILQELRNPRFAIKWGKAYYGSEDFGWCIELVAYDVSVNIVFINGSQLKGPPELGDETRYVKIRNIEEAKSGQVTEWVKQSCQMPGWSR